MKIDNFFRWLNHCGKDVKNINWSGRAKKKDEISVVINVRFNEVSSLINLLGDLKEDDTHIMTIRNIDFSAKFIKTIADVDEAIRALQELKPKIERGYTRNTICPIVVSNQAGEDGRI